MRVLIILLINPTCPAVHLSVSLAPLPKNFHFPGSFDAPQDRDHGIKGFYVTVT